MVNKQNDWFAANIMAPQNTLNDFRQEGLTADNTELLSKDKYLANENIKKVFVDKQGKFDQKLFDDAYNAATLTYNKFSNDDFDKTTLNDSYYFKENVLAPKNNPKARLITQESSFKRVANPFKNVTGFAGTNINTSNSGLSIRELAQKSEVKDINGKSMGWTPQDDAYSGILDFWKKPAVVLSQWDEDGFHEDPMTGEKKRHSKGQFKTNENGDFFYEELGDRDPANKIMLSVWDTNTNEGTWANKYDFMDSDGIDKSIYGSIAKAAALAAPAFIPGVGQWYTGALMGKELLEVLPATGQAIGSILGYDTQKWANAKNSRSLSRRLTSSTSDYSKANAFTAENIANMMSDVFLQLSQQRLLAKIPHEYGLLKAETEAVKKAKLMYGDAKVSELLKDAGFATKNQAEKLEMLNSIPGLSGVIDKYSKLGTLGGQFLSTAYMAGTSAIGVMDEAKRAGLNDKDSGAMLLGLTAGYAVMMRALKVGHWVEEGVGIDGLGNSMRKAIKEAGKQYSDDIIKAKNLTDATNAFLRIGKRMGTFVSNKMQDNQYILASFAEGTEELSEELMSDSLKTAYNALNALGLSSTKNKEAKFDFTMEDMLTRYAMNFLGGAAGGAIFKLNENFSRASLQNNGIEAVKDLAYFVRNGYTDKLLDEIKKQEKKGVLGSKNLSMTLAEDQDSLDSDQLVYQATNDPNNSHNSFISDVLSGQVKYLDGIIRQENIPSDNFLNQIYSERIGTAIDLGINSSMRDDMAELTSQIIQKRIAIDKIKDGEKTANPELTKLTDEINELRKNLIEISSGDKFDYYYKQALFTMNQNINGAYGVLTMNDFAKKLYNKPLSDFDLHSDEYKAIRDAYTSYIKDSRKDVIKNSFEDFQKDLEKTSKSADELNDYGNHRYGYYEKVEDVEAFSQGITSETALDSAKEAMKAKFRDADKYDPTIIDNVLATNKFMSPEFKQVIDETYSKFNKETTNYQSLENEELAQAFASNKEIGFGYGNRDFDGDSLDEYVGRALNGLNSFLNKLDINSSNSNQVKAKIREFLTKDSDFSREFQNGNVDGFSLDEYSFRNPNLINDLSDQIFNSLMMKNPEMAQAIEGYERSLKTLETKSKYNPLHELLKKFLIEIEGTKSTTPLEVLQTQMNIFDNIANVDDFVIDNIKDKEQIDSAIKAIQKVRSMMYSLTNYSFTPDNYHGGDIYGFGAATNHLLEKNKKPKEFELLTTRANAAIYAELGYMEARLKFLQILSDYNDDNKIGNFKLAGIKFPALLLSSYLPDSEFHTIIKELGIDTSELDKLFDDSDNVSSIIEAMASGDQKSIENYDDFIMKFDIERTKIEHELYKSVQDKINSFKTDSEKIQFKNTLVEKIVNSFTGVEFSSLINKQNSDFNKSIMSLYPMDKIAYAISTMFDDSALFYESLRGNKIDEENYDGLQKFPFSPFSAQEYNARLAVARVNASNEFNHAQKTIYKKLDEMANDNNNPNQKMAKEYMLTNVFMYNSMFLNGSPGAGKSSGTANAAINIFVNQGKKIAIFGSLQEQGENLFDNISFKDDPEKSSAIVNRDSGKSKNELFNLILGEETYAKLKQQQQVLNEKENDLIREIPASDNFATFRVKKEAPEFNDLYDNTKKLRIEINGLVPNVIMIDEATHLSKFEIELLNQAVFKHNKGNTEKITVIFVGDKRQNGFSIESEGQYIASNLNEVFTFTAPTLFQTIRTSYNIKTRNINNVLAYGQQLSQFIQENPDLILFKDFNNILKGMKMDFHYDEENGLIGEKFVNQITETDIKRIIDDNNKLENPSKIGIIVDDIANNPIVKIIAANPDYTEHFEIRTPNNVQGKEYDYIIVDIKNPIPIPNSSIHEMDDYLSRMYTAISRSKIGTLSTNQMLLGVEYENKTGEVYPSKTKISDSKIEDFKKFRIDVVNAILSEVQPMYPSITTGNTTSISSNAGNQTASKVENTTEDPNSIPPPPVDPFDIGQPPFENEEQPNEVNGINDPNSSLPVSGNVDTDFIVEDFNDRVASDPNEVKKNDTDIRSYASYERLGVIINSGTVISSNSNEDFDGVFKVLNKGKNPNSISIDSNEYKIARNQLRQIVAGFVTSTKQKTAKVKRSLVDNLTNLQKVSPEIMNNYDFNNFVLALRVKRYSQTDKRNDAYYSKYEMGPNGKKVKVEANDGDVVGFIVAEIPSKKANVKPLTITISGLARMFNTNSYNNEKLPGEVKAALQELMEEYNARSLNEKTDDVKFYIKKELYDSVLTERSSLIPTKLYISDDDGVKTSTIRNESLAEFRRTHTHLNISDVYIYTGYEQEKLGKQPIESGKPFILVSTNKAHGDLMLAYENQKIEEKRILDSGGSLNQILRDIKLVPLNNHGVKFSEWYRSNKSIFDQQNQDVLKRMARVYSGKYSGVRMHNAIVKFLQTAIISYNSKNNKSITLNDIWYVSSEGKYDIKDVIKASNINEIKSQYPGLDVYSNEDIANFALNAFNAMVYTSSSAENIQNKNSFVVIKNVSKDYENKVNIDKAKYNISEVTQVEDNRAYQFLNNIIKSFDNKLIQSGDASAREEQKNKALEMFDVMFSKDFPDGIHYNASIYDRRVADSSHWALKADVNYGSFDINVEMSLPFLHISLDMLTGLSNKIVNRQDEIIESANNLQNFINNPEFKDANNNFLLQHEFKDEFKQSYFEVLSRLKSGELSYNEAASTLQSNFDTLKTKQDELLSKPHIINGEIQNLDLNSLGINSDEYDIKITNNGDSVLSNDFILDFNNKNNENFATFTFENGVLTSSEIHNQKANEDQVDLVKLKEEVNNIFNQLSVNPNIGNEIETIRQFYNKAIETGSLLLMKNELSKDFNKKVLPSIKAVMKSDSKEKIKLLELLNELNNILEC